jgi:hypothetical protein
MFKLDWVLVMIERKIAILIGALMILTCGFTWIQYAHACELENVILSTAELTTYFPAHGRLLGCTIVDSKGGSGGEYCRFSDGSNLPQLCAGDPDPGYCVHGYSRP